MKGQHEHDFMTINSEVGNGGCIDGRLFLSSCYGWSTTISEISNGINSEPPLVHGTASFRWHLLCTTSSCKDLGIIGTSNSGA